jgi:hypothetical protein
MFRAPAQREAVWLESQTGLRDLQVTGAESAHQTAQAAGARQARGSNCAGRDRRSVVDGLHARHAQ